LKIPGEIKMALVLIAGGGTGGHIYPAVAIAQGILKQDPNASVEFVGTAQGLESKIIPREKFKLHLICAGALNNVSLVTKILSLLLLPLGIIQSIILILKLKPNIIVGVGGYASGPMMLAAVILQRRTAVFEPNSYPGLTNRKLAPFVDLALVNFEVTKKFFKNAKLLGMPVRNGMEISSLKVLPNSHSGKLKVLIFGGSQGARGINRTVLSTVQNNLQSLKDFEIVHQIGATDWAHYDSEYKKINPGNIQWFEFLYDMPVRYAWADLVICRAGAATLSELASLGKAAVIIPFPFAADNHQQKNAEALESQGACEMIEQKDFTSEKFIEILKEFDSQREKLTILEHAVIRFHIPNAKENIAKTLLAT